MSNTDWDIVETADFKSAGMRIIWKTGDCSRCTNVYVPSEDAKTWDGASTATHAIGSRFGGYSYIELVQTGRKLTKGPQGVYGVRCRVTFINIDAEGAHVGGSVTAWIIDPAATMASY